MSIAAALEILVNARTSQATAALTRMNAQTKAVAAQADASAMATAASWEKAGTRMQATGKKLTTHVGLPAAAIGAVAVKTAMDFHQSMLLIQTSAGASADEVQNLSKQVLDFAASGKTEFGPNQLAQGLYAIESAGIRGGRAMETLKKSSDLATIGQSDLADTTKALAAAQKTGIKGSKNLDHTIGTLNATVGAGQMHLQELVSAMGTGFLSAAKQMGLNLSEVGASLAELTKQGVPATAAATRLRMALTQMATISTRQGASSAITSIGLGADQLANTMRSKGLLPALELLHKHLDGISKVQQTNILSQAFGGARSGTAIMMLVNNLGDLRDTLDQVHKNSDQVNQSLKAADANPAVRMHQIWAQIQVSLVKIGDSLIPIVKDMAGVVAALAAGFAKFPSFARDLLIGAIAIGPMLRILGFWVSLIAKVRELYLIIKAGEGLGGIMALIGGGRAAAGAKGATRGIEDMVRGISGIGPAAVGAEAETAGLAATLSGPLAIAAGVVAVGALAYLAVSLSDNRSAFQKAEAAAADFQKSAESLAPAVRHAADTHKALADSVARVTKLERAGKGGSAAWQAAIIDQAHAWRANADAIAHRQGLADDMQSHLGDFHNQMQDLKAENATLRTQAGSWQENAAQIADNTNKLNLLQKQWNAMWINRARAMHGLDPLGADMNQALGTFRNQFGRGASVKVGLIGDKEVVSQITQMSNQLAFIGKKPFVAKVLANAKNPADMLNRLHNMLMKISGGKWSLNMSAPGLRDTITQVQTLHGQVKGLATMRELTHNPFGPLASAAQFEFNKINGLIEQGKLGPNRLAAAYEAMRRRIKQALAAGSIDGKQYTQMMNTLLSGEMRALGVGLTPKQGNRVWQRNTGPGRGAALQTGGPVVVPGYGSGDKVPAMLEPGEVVWNKKAVQTVFGSANAANAANQMWPRFATGGAVVKSGTTVKDLHFTPANSGMIDTLAAGTLNKEADAVRMKLSKAKAKAARRAAAGGGATGPGGLGTFQGLPVANWIIPILQWAKGHGWHGSITSGYRSPTEVVHSSMVAPQGHSNHNFTSYPGGAIDVGSPSARAAGQMLANVIAKYPRRPNLVWGGPVIGDWGHFSATGHQKGGIVQALAKGGIASNQIIHDYARAAADTKAPRKAVQALMEAGLAESNSGGQFPIDLPGGDRTSQGTLQLLASTASSHHVSPHDEYGVAKEFLTSGYWGKGGAINLSKSHSAAMTAHLTQGNATGSGVYASQAHRASQLVAGSGLTFPGDRAVLGAASGVPGAGKGAKTGNQGDAFDMLDFSKLPIGKDAQDFLRKASKSRAKMSATNDRYADFAQRASDLGDLVGGLDQAGWLHKQLDVLVDLRNMLITAYQMLVAAVERLNEQIKKTKHKGAIQALTKLRDGANAALGVIGGALNDPTDGVQGNVIGADPFALFSSGDILGMPGAFGGKIGEVLSSLTQAAGDSTDAGGSGSSDDLTALQLQQALDALARANVTALQTPIMSQLPQMIAGATGNPFLGGFAGGGTIASRGLALVGENGPELAQFPVGTRISPNGQGMAVAGAVPQISVELHGDLHTNGSPIEDAVKVYVDGKLAQDASFARRRR